MQAANGHLDLDQVSPLQESRALRTSHQFTQSGIAKVNKHHLASYYSSDSRDEPVLTIVTFYYLHFESVSQNNYQYVIMLYRYTCIH